MLNRRMVDRLIREGHITDAAVERAFRSVLRHRFLPRRVPLREAYRDVVVALRSADGSGALPAGTCESSSTMPSLLAGVLSAAEVAPGMRVLQVGTGPGYLVALLATLTTLSGQVVTVELDPELSTAAHVRFGEMGLRHVYAIHGDGYLGYEHAAPYDRIVVTAACRDVAPSWYRQLREDGQLLLPLVLGGDASAYPLMSLRKRGTELSGSVVGDFVHVRFVPLQRPSDAPPERAGQLRAAVRQEVMRHFAGGGRTVTPRALALYADLELLASHASGDRSEPVDRPEELAAAIVARWHADGAPHLPKIVFRVRFDAPPTTGWRWRFATPGRSVEVYLSQ